MAFREVAVYEVREVLRLWLRGEGIRATQRLAGVDRKTVRRYVAAAEELGLDRGGGEASCRMSSSARWWRRFVRTVWTGMARRGGPWTSSASRSASGWSKDGLIDGEGRAAAGPPRGDGAGPHPGPVRGRAVRATSGPGGHGAGGGRGAGPGAAGRLRADGPDRGPRHRTAAGLPRPDLHRVPVPVLLRVAVLRPDHGGGDRGLRGGLGLLRRGLPRRDPGQPDPGGERCGSVGAAVQSGVRRVRPGPRLS